MSHHIAPQVTHANVRSNQPLHVVGVVSNVERYHSRYRLAREWIERTAATANVKLHIVEAAFGDRQHELDVPAGVSKLELRVQTSAWIKENMINLGAKHLLPRDWQYVCWEDCDVEHRDPNWAQETVHQLQHFSVVQPWEHCLDLGPNGNVIATHTSFGCVHQSGAPKQSHPSQPYKYAHSGYSWACTRRFFEEVEGLLDCAILGSADHHMAWSMIGQVECSMHGKANEVFKRRCRDWQRKAYRACNGDVGFVPGRIEHSWHGNKASRQYRSRWEILVEHDFDPDTDLRRDDQGVWFIHGKPKLEQAIRSYNRSRLEDSIDQK